MEVNELWELARAIELDAHKALRNSPDKARGLFVAADVVGDRAFRMEREQAVIDYARIDIFA